MATVNGGGGGGGGGDGGSCDASGADAVDVLPGERFTVCSCADSGLAIKVLVRPGGPGACFIVFCNSSPRVTTTFAACGGGGLLVAASATKLSRC